MWYADLFFISLFISLNQFGSEQNLRVYMNESKVQRVRPILVVMLHDTSTHVIIIIVLSVCEKVLIDTVGCRYNHSPGSCRHEV